VHQLLTAGGGVAVMDRRGTGLHLEPDARKAVQNPPRLEVELIEPAALVGGDQAQAGIADEVDPPHRNPALEVLGRPAADHREPTDYEVILARIPGVATSSRMSCTCRLIQRAISLVRTTSLAPSLRRRRSSALIIKPRYTASAVASMSNGFTDSTWGCSSSCAP